MLYGIDVSNHQGDSIDFQKVKAAGYSVVYLKVTEGVTYIDKYVDLNAHKCKEAGLDFGFYHYLKSSDPVRQAEVFYEKIKQYDYTLKPVLDVEENFNGINDAVMRFSNRFKELCSDSLVLYTYSSFLNNFDVCTCDNIGYIWEANYNNKQDLWSLPVNSRKANCCVLGHQYSEKGLVDGISGNVDVNVFSKDIFINSDKVGYIVTDYLPNGYNGTNDFEGVDLEYVLSYMKNSKGLPIRCYARGNSNGVWIETQCLPYIECQRLAKVLGSWFYEIRLKK